MKYLLILLLVLVLVGVWRSRRAPPRAGPQKARPAALTQDMAACAHCGVHVPQAEAVVHAGRAYCCAEHGRRGPP